MQPAYFVPSALKVEHPGSFVVVNRCSVTRSQMCILIPVSQTTLKLEFQNYDKYSVTGISLLISG